MGENRTLNHCFAMFRFLALLTLCVGLVTPSVFAQVALTSTLMGVSDEGAIHRVSISLPDGARVQSVYADNGQPMSVTAEEGFAQSDGEVILADAASADSVDSWFTIGLPGAATELYSTGGTVWNDAVASFAGGGDFVSDDALGGAFFLLPSSSQGVASNGEVLLAQLVSDGPIDVVLNVQWKPSAGAPSVYSEGLTLTLTPPAGCTDPTAENFDAEALLDDGSCTYPEGGFAGLIYELTQPAALDVAPTYRVYALLDNPNESVTSWFGTAESPLAITSSAAFLQLAGGSAGHPGTDAGEVYNRDSWLSIGDAPGAYFVGLSLSEFEAGGVLASDSTFGGAVVLVPGSSTQGQPDAQGRVLLAQLTTPGAVDIAMNLKVQLASGETEDYLDISLSIPATGPGGCNDDTACNFDAEAAVDDGSCLYDDALGICGGDCPSDADADGVCDNAEIPGCTDPQAPNYLPQATDDDGSCLSEDDSTDPVDGFLGLVQEATAAHTDSLMVHRIYAQFDTAGYEVLAMFGTPEAPLHFSAEAGFHQDASAGPLATDLPAAGAAPTDSWLTLGGEGPGSVDLFSIGMDFEAFEAGGNLLVDSEEGGALFIIPGTQPATVSGADGRVLLAQVASTGMVEVQLNLKVEVPGGGAPEILGLQLVVPPFIPGCMDTLACNFDADATADDGSCVLADDPCETCEGGAVVDNDADGDGVCDADETTGCGDIEACNYNALPTLDATSDACIYATANCASCSGETDGTGTVLIADADGDGVCDADEITGCTNPMACNFDATPTTDSDNTLCVFTVGPCDTCSGETDGTGTVVDNDADNDGVCNADESEGCTDPDACNYNNAENLDSDNSQCIYPASCQECSGALDGTGTVVDVVGGPEGCTYELACNYDPNACQEDGSCLFAEPGKDCDGQCLWDFNGDGTCDEPGTGGCTYPSAYNYDASAPYDDGTCDFPTGNCAFDNNRDGDVNVTDLLDMLVALGTTCD